MEITERITRNIVSEISSTIHQAVNLMNAEGMIIASTNPKRVGTLHKGAEKIIRERLECLEIYSDGEYQNGGGAFSFRSNSWNVFVRRCIACYLCSECVKRKVSYSCNAGSGMDYFKYTDVNTRVDFRPGDRQDARVDRRVCDSGICSNYYWKCTS